MSQSVFGSGPSDAPRSWTVRVDSEGTLYVDLESGSVCIEAHDRSVVCVETAVTPRDLVSFSLERRGDDVYLEGECEPGLGAPICGARVQVRAKVPRRFSVDVSTRNGRIRVSDIGGRVAAETTAGEIQVQRISGPMLLRTAGGSIRAREGRGDLHARTLGGSIVVKNVHGNVDLKSGGGSIRASRIGGRIEAKTGAGLIAASFSGDPAGSLQTGAGSVVVSLLPGAAVNLDARADVGRVHIDDRIPLEGRRSGSRLTGRIGTGGAQLRLRAGVGSVHLRERRAPRAPKDRTQPV